MKISNTGLARYEYLENIDTLYWEWQDATKNADWDTFKEALIEYVEIAEKCKAETHVVNEQEQHIILQPEYQDWIDKNISVRNIAIGCKHIAIIQRDDIFEQVATEQLFEEENSQTFNFRAFDNKEKAFNWVKQFA